MTVRLILLGVPNTLSSTSTFPLILDIGIRLFSTLQRLHSHNALMEEYAAFCSLSTGYLLAGLPMIMAWASGFCLYQSCDDFKETQPFTCNKSLYIVWQSKWQQYLPRQFLLIESNLSLKSANSVWAEGEEVGIPVQARSLTQISQSTTFYHFKTSNLQRGLCSFRNTTYPSQNAKPHLTHLQDCSVRYVKSLALSKGNSAFCVLQCSVSGLVGFLLFPISMIIFYMTCQCWSPRHCISGGLTVVLI